jgi:hypothetical protein
MFGCDNWAYTYGRKASGEKSWQQHNHFNCNHPFAYGWVAVAYFISFCVIGSHVRPPVENNVSLDFIICLIPSAHFFLLVQEILLDFMNVTYFPSVLSLPSRFSSRSSSASW